MNRSIELSKLLGIKPRITYWDSVVALKMIPQERIYTKDIYPDLTKPSNFVKLLELHYYCFEYLPMDGVAIAYGDAKDFQEELILYFTSYFSPNGLKVSKLGRIIDVEKIKQQAQQIEWEY